MLTWLRSSLKRPAAETEPADPLAAYPAVPDVLRQALTHKSAGVGADNERLEFLGDAVIEIVISEHLYRSHPEYTEGQLTQARVVAVSEPTLAEAARRLQLGKRIRMSRGEESSGGRERPSILSDAFEAVVAAIYLSSGMETASRFVIDQVGGALGEISERDFKSRLQEHTQQAMRETPAYRIVGESGPPHDRFFNAEVTCSGKVLGRGSGRSKKIAEQAAAELALEGLLRCSTQSREPKSPSSESSAVPASTDS